jgi:hypothetical protein
MIFQQLDPVQVKLRDMSSPGPHEVSLPTRLVMVGWYYLWQEKRDENEVVIRK